MIVGVGIDSIEIDRFKLWASYAHTTLERIFSAEEIEYCLSIPVKSAERFAARFAAREAFFKALSSINLPAPIPFLSLCKMVQVNKTENGNPQLMVDWQSIWNMAKVAAMEHPRIHLTFTHNKTTATAFVIIEDK